MKRYLLPSSLLFYLFSAVIVFIVGVFLAKALGAGEGQGLAAAAIVLGYGVMAGILALIFAIFTLSFMAQNKVILVNKILALVLAGLIIMGVLRLKSRQNQTDVSSRTPLMPTVPLVKTAIAHSSVDAETFTGLGMCQLESYGNRHFYFYNILNSGDTSIHDHLPSDSLVFRQTDQGFEIAYAPPWFVPAHLKMDYGILFLRIVSVQKNRVEIVVNESNGMTKFVDRFQVELQFWPEFLLNMNTVEPIDHQNNPIRIKPSSHASPVNQHYSFLKPVRVTQEWIQVELLDQYLNSMAEGWLKWQEDGKFLISYSLLS